MSVIGRSTNSTGVSAAITAPQDGNILRRQGTTIGFGNILLSSPNSVTGTLPVARGGTNLTTYTTGDLIYASATNTLTRRAIGTTGQVLTVSGGLPTWANAVGEEKRQVFVGGTDYTAGTTTTLTLTNTPIATSSAGLDIVFDGVTQISSEWSYNTGTGVITFTSAIPVGVLRVEARWRGNSALSIGIS